MKKPKMILFDYGQTLVNAQSFDGVRRTEAVLQYAVKNPCHKSAEEVWYVGDQYQCDIVGAKEAGLFPVWYIGAIDMKYEPREDVVTVKDWKELRGYFMGLDG